MLIFNEFFQHLDYSSLLYIFKKLSKELKYPFMKIVILALLIFAFTGCTKPSNQDVPIDPTKAYTIKYDLNDQVVITRVSNDTLHLNFNQKINFLVDPVEYRHTWALHLVQGFTNSYLNNLHFDAIANSSGYAHDWVPINLNDVEPSQKIISDTTVNGIQYLKVTLTRIFEFYSVFSDQQAAINEQNTLLQINTDAVLYSAFYSYNNVNSLSNNITVKIVYIK